MFIELPTVKILVLTTDTLHHAFYIHELSQLQYELFTVIETGRVKPPFETKHSYETQRDAYEKSFFFNEDPPKINKLNACHEVDNINSRIAIETILNFNPSLIISFGVRIITSKTLKALPFPIYNFHGGCIARYRGLDSHLWAIYHKDFAALQVTFHCLIQRVDAGTPVFVENIKLTKNMPLHKLRAKTTEHCVNITKEFLGKENTTPLRKVMPASKLGRYYSFMPSVLKEIAANNFVQHTATL